MTAPFGPIPPTAIGIPTMLLVPMVRHGPDGGSLRRETKDLPRTRITTSDGALTCRITPTHNIRHGFGPLRTEPSTLSGLRPKSHYIRESAETTESPAPPDMP